VGKDEWKKKQKQKTYKFFFEKMDDKCIGKQVQQDFRMTRKEGQRKRALVVVSVL
jgi:hypothetical protein